jgi:cell division protein FtsW (lipid II flippase)
LPEVHADSIFAILAEEMGFAITVLFLVLLLAIILRSYQVAKNSENEFGRLVACGIISWWLFIDYEYRCYCWFITFDWSSFAVCESWWFSLFINMLALGILLNISRKNK